ncbi:arylsulfatase [Saccharopolyspora shandongensis]|uniref:arylsulfatase n=1 Tax=Saccharopolyspora shandongensis TaxID=418495 RepID=UPI003439E3BD
MGEPSFSGQVGRTVADSTPWWPEQVGGGARRPNVVTVILDDTGWSDLGCFGSEIATPVIDRLAGNGLRYNNFHVTPLCSPTRASLLTGRNHHSVGMRFLADTDTGFPNSRGRVDPEIPLLPTRLRSAGYGSYLAGKWHLAPLHEITPAGPFDNWPLARGFDRFYGFLDGCTDQYAPELYEDNHAVAPPRTEGYHLSEDLADRAIGFVGDHLAFRPGDPFYLQLAFGATHAPFQAPREYIDPYVEVFAKGWDRTRQDRLARQIASGLVPDGTELAPRNPGVPAWDALSAERRTLYTHLQAAYAGFLEHTDAQLGRVVAALERWGVLDDTVIAVMSDNGASREGGPDGAVDVNGPYSGIPQTIDQQLARLDRLGGPDGPAHYPEGWAMAGNTPFRRYKQFVDLGGVRSPLVVHWPNGISRAGEVRDQFVDVIDLAPTVLDLAGTGAEPGMDGRSIEPTFQDGPAPRDTQYFEMFGHRAIWHSGWKAVTEHATGADYERDEWRLYDTTSDFSEHRDLAAHHPERLRLLKDLWEQEATANSVFPLDDRPLKELLGLRGPQGLPGRRRIVLRPGQGHVPLASAVTGSDRSMRVTARLNRVTGTEQGVLLASGSSYGGYVLYLQHGRAVFEHLLLDQRSTCSSTPVPDGPCEVGFQLERRDDRSAHVDLLIGDEIVAKTEIPITSAHLSCFGLDVGRDPVSQVSRSYEGEFAFPGHALVDVTIDFLEELPLDELADAIHGTE